MKEKDLIRKKEEIEQIKQELAEMKGEYKSLLTRLKKDWDCNSLQDAKKKIQTFEKEVNSIEDSIEEQTKILKETYFNEEDI